MWLRNEYILRNDFRFPMDGKVDVFCPSGQSNLQGAAQPQNIDRRDLVRLAENSFRYNSAGSAHAGINPGDWGPMQVGVNTGGLPHQGTEFGSEVGIAAHYYANYLKPSYWIKVGMGGWGVAPTLRNSGTFHPDYDSGSGHALLTAPQNAGITRLLTQYGIAEEDCRFHFLWIQGETDATFSPDDANYGTNFQRVYDDMMTGLNITFDSETCVYISDEFTQVPTAGRNLVNAALAAWVAADPVKRRGLTPNSKFSVKHDKIHYDAPGQQTLGTELFKLIFSA